MPHRSSTRKPWLALGMAPAMAMLLSCASSDKSAEEAQTAVVADPPPAVAPPDPGVEPPAVRLLDPTGPPVPPEARPQVQLTAWSAAMSTQLDIPKAALQAYGYAAREVATSKPGCGLGWPVLAGIGAIESSHGRYAGAKLDATGRPTVAIRGLPLDGTRGVKRIVDTDRGVLDGDPAFDRAIGPLQFIPGTWQQWSVDADGDRIADPNDIDDAALTAAHYLCTVGGDLRKPDRFWAALLTYNESRNYGQDVLDHADHYGRTSRAVAIQR